MIDSKKEPRARVVVQTKMTARKRDNLKLVGINEGFSKLTDFMRHIIDDKLDEYGLL
jgi:hypothetical protein